MVIADYVSIINNLYNKRCWCGVVLMEWSEVLLFVVKIIFVIFAVIVIIQLIMKITGHSPIDVANYKIGKFVGGMNEFKKEMREFKEITKNSFAKLREDLKKK